MMEQSVVSGDEDSNSDVKKLKGVENSGGAGRKKGLSYVRLPAKTRKKNTSDRDRVSKKRPRCKMPEAGSSQTPASSSSGSQVSDPVPPVSHEGEQKQVIPNCQLKSSPSEQSLD